jgi:SAM-dependent methyltransferase
LPSIAGDRSEGAAGWLVRLARRARTAAYVAASPLDYSFRALNHLRDYPPLHLRRHVGGSTAGFDGPGYEFVAYLRLLAGLRAGNFLWDLGCGCGMLELALRDFGWRGRVVGTDIHRPCIEWARKHIAAKTPGVEFVHMDVRNPAYWPKGRSTAKEWLLGFRERGFDVVVAKSLFTHVLPDELDVYLGDVAGRLAAGGRALLTFFVLPADGPRSAGDGEPRIAFRPFAEDGRCAVRSLLAPTAAVAYDEGFLRQKLERAGFDPANTTLHPGMWTGRRDGLSFQDLFLVAK